jgi:hypothetical protein
MTAPDPEATASARAIADALKEAGGAGETRLYINAHGTGTPLNDKTETKAIRLALGGRADEALVSSTKSMTGHMLGAAGAVEAIAAILALREGIVPPTIGLQEPDPDCDLDYVPNEARARALGLALSVSLGFGGHNACLAIRRRKTEMKIEGFTGAFGTMNREEIEKILPHRETMLLIDEAYADGETARGIQGTERRVVPAGTFSGNPVVPG